MLFILLDFLDKVEFAIFLHLIHFHCQNIRTVTFLNLD